MTDTTEVKPATDEEIAEWNPAGRNIAAAIYPWRVAKLIARIEQDREQIAELEVELAQAVVPDDHEAEERAVLQARIAELETEVII